MIGKNLAHYKVLGSLGKGGMGEVYLAEDSRLGRKVALKTLPPEMASDPERRARFEREAKVVAALNHPNIVTIHSVEDHDGLSFITMEHVEGEVLSELIPEGGMPLSHLYDVAAPLADALAAAHEKGITHRDLKPGNVMVTKEGRVKVLDFGLAKVAGTPAAEDVTATVTAPMTVEGKILGTVSYMSPEQAEGKPVDPRSDVFSLGVLLYEMATGQKPFGGDSTVSTLSAILRDTPREIMELNPSSPRHLGRIVQRCLAKEPSRRYQTALDVRNELESLRQETDSAAGQPTPVALAESAPKRNGTLLAGLATVAILMVAATAAMLWLREQPAPSPGRAAVAASEPNSIAVLPFANMSGDPDNEYFSDGLAEELLNVLARLKGLRVAARTSSFHFKGYTGDIGEIGEQLNVATVLEGSVRRAGDKVRVTAQLINAADGFHLWSDTYDRELDDIFGIQEDIAKQVVSALEVTLLGEEVTRLAKRPTDNLEAYDNYLLGQQRMARRREGSLKEAVEYFQKAIDLDPEYALAYVGLADATMLLQEYGDLQIEEAIARAKPLVDKALDLDIRLGEAYASLGNLTAWTGDYEATEQAYRRAIELNPGYATAYMWYGLQVAGRDWKRAMELYRKALELDPLSAVANANLAYALAETGHLDESLERYRHVIEIDPGFAVGYRTIADFYMNRLDRPDDAITWLERGFEVAPDDLIDDLSSAYQALGRFEEDIALWRGAIERDPDEWMHHAGLAGSYRYFGHFDQAIEVLRRGVKANPESWRPYMFLAACFRDLGQIDEAVRMFHEGKERGAPLLARVDFIQTFLWLDDEASAQKNWEQVIAFVPDAPFARFLELVMLIRNSRLVEGEAVARAMDEEQPGNWSAETAFFEMKAGRYEDARDSLAKAFPRLFKDDAPKINWDNLQDTITVAVALLKTGEHERGEMFLRKSQAFLDSHDEGVRRANSRIEPVYIYALQGRKDDALAALRLAIDQGWRDDCERLKQDPGLEPLMGDLRFQAMLAEVRADLMQQRQRLAAEGLATPL